MFTLEVYFTVHFTIRFSSPFAGRWFMVLQILSARPAQGTDLGRNLPGLCPCPCCSFIYNCPYLWVKLEQFLPNDDKLVSCSLVLVLVFGGWATQGLWGEWANMQGAKFRATLNFPLAACPPGPMVGCWGLLACCGTADPVSPGEEVPFLALRLLAWSMASGHGWSLPVLCPKGLSGAAGIKRD